MRWTSSSPNARASLPPIVKHSTRRSIQWRESRNQSRKHRRRSVATIEPELELFGIAAKVFRADMNVRSLDAAFQVTPEALDLVH